jgi:hypothetical protein
VEQFTENFRIASRRRGKLQGISLPWNGPNVVIAAFESADEADLNGFIGRLRIGGRF